MDGFRTTDRPKILSCLTPDVEWLIPGLFQITGQDAFAQHIVEEGFEPRPEIDVTRVIEQGDFVVAEGAVRAKRTDGSIMRLLFCDVFEMQNAKIRRLTSYLAVLK